MATINQDDRFIRLMSEEEDQRKMLNTRILEGIEQGREEGIISGINQATINIATSMLKKDMSIKDISEITKLSEKEIIDLKVKLENKN